HAPSLEHPHEEIERPYRAGRRRIEGQREPPEPRCRELVPRDELEERATSFGAAHEDVMVRRELLQPLGPPKVACVSVDQDPHRDAPRALMVFGPTGAASRSAGPPTA